MVKIYSFKQIQEIINNFISKNMFVIICNLLIDVKKYLLNFYIPTLFKAVNFISFEITMYCLNTEEQTLTI